MADLLVEGGSEMGLVRFQEYGAGEFLGCDQYWDQFQFESSSRYLMRLSLIFLDVLINIYLMLRHTHNSMLLCRSQSQIIYYLFFSSFLVAALALTLIIHLKPIPAMNENLEQFQSLLFDTLLSTAGSSQAEAQLLAFRNQNPQQFISLCSIITCSQNKKDEIRLAAGTLLAAAVRMKHQNLNTFNWDALSPQLKQQIKNSLLESLISQSESAKRSAANAIASIASIQFPRQEWENMLPVLVNIINGQNIEQMKTAVMTLGFINSQLTKAGIKPTHNQSQLILAGILVGLQKAEVNTEIKSNVRNTLLNSLRDSIILVVDLLSNAQAKQHIMKSIFYGINDPQTTISALQTLEQLCKHAYCSIEEYVPHFHKSLNDIVNRDSEQAIAAIEIWNVMGKQYLERVERSHAENPNYLVSVSEFLCDILINQLVRKGISEELINTIVETLETIVMVSGVRVFDKILVFVSSSLKNQNEQFRRSAVLVFSSLIETREQFDTAMQHFDKGFEALLSTMDDPNPTVIKYSLQGWSRIFNRIQFRTAFVQKGNCQANINQFLKHALSEKKSSEIQYLAINTVYNLFNELHMYQKTESDDLLIKLLKALTDYSFQTRVEYLSTMGFCCVIMILISSESTKINEHYIDHLIQVLESMNSPSLEMIHSALNVISVGIKKMSSINPNLNFMRKIFSFIIKYFVNTQKIHQSCIQVLASLAYTYKKNFEQCCVQAEQYLIQGLLSFQDNKLYRSSLEYLSDIANNLRRYLQRSFPKFMNLLIEGLKADIPRELKINIFDTIGECVSGVGLLAEPYLQTLVETITLCFNISSEPCQQNDYIQQLRFCIIKLQNSLLLCFGQQGYQNPMYKQHFKLAIQYILLTTEKQFNPPVNYFQEAIEVAFYGAKQFGFMDMINTPSFEEKLKILDKFGETEECLKETLMIIRMGLESYRVGLSR